MAQDYLFKNSRKSKTTFPLGNDGQLVFEREYDDDQYYLDTKVSLNDSEICWISWDSKDEFTKELTTIIDKFRI